MRTFHLFAGAGGGLLADLILGHEPVAAIEWNPIACQVLRDRAADGWFPGLEVVEADVRTIDFRKWAGRVDCIAAGFPCQDISSAGRGAGIEGSRSGLYREVVRAIDAIRPRFVWLENSPIIRTRGRHIVIADLVARGYAWRDGKLAAADVGAGHERSRWWCIAANADGLRQLESKGRIPDEWRRDCDGTPQADADALRDRLEIAIQRGGLCETDASAIEAAARHTGAFDWSPPDIGICRVVDGMAAKLDEGTYADQTEQRPQGSTQDCETRVVRQLRLKREIGGSPHRQGSHEQRSDESDGVMREMPPSGAHPNYGLRPRSRTCATSEMHDLRGNIPAEKIKEKKTLRKSGMPERVGAQERAKPMEHEMNRMERLKCAGNGQVPLAAAAAWRILGGP